MELYRRISRVMDISIGGRLAAAQTLLLCGLTLACSGDPTGPDLLGEWGGEGAAAVVAADLTTFEFDCANARVEAPLLLDPDGKFSVEGLYFREGGPLPVDGRPSIPARFDGTVTGDRMTLTIHLIGLAQEPIGPRELRKGRTPLLRKCL
ncbi:MAG: hypothetical protein O7I93_05810 [Gemmatimonadetes bacterium]|nr:hypothetical protein [Gemmatimonadota bacterium]